MPVKSVPKICAHCQETFMGRNRGQTKFCSRSCSAASQRRTARRGPRPTRNCDRCGDPYRQMGPRQLHCRHPICASIDFHNRVLAPWAQKVAKAEESAQARERRAWVRQLLKRDRRLDHSKLIARVAAADPELAALIAEQERDDRLWDTAPPWEVSLDARLGEDGLSRIDLVTSEGVHAFSTDRNRLGPDAPWVPPLIERIDRQREIDRWATAA